MRLQTPELDLLRATHARLLDRVGDAGVLAEILPVQHEMHLIERAIHIDSSVYGIRVCTEFLEEEAPLTLASYLVWKGVHDYQSGNYWDFVKHAIPALTLNYQIHWSHAFETILGRYRLARFAEVEGHRYVTPILLHGGIPDHCLPDLFEQLLFPIAEGRFEYTGRPRDVIDDWLETSYEQRTDKPVRRFLKHGGKVAEDYLDRAIEAVQQVVQGAPQRPHPGLSPGFLDELEKWRAGRSLPSPSSQRVQRLRLPEVILQPGGPNLIIVVPSQRLPAEGSRKDLSVSVLVDGKQARSLPLLGTLSGPAIDTERHEIVCGIGSQRISVELQSGGESVRKWEPYDRSMGTAFFDGETGIFYSHHQVSGTDVWALLPLGAALDSDATVIEEVNAEADGVRVLHVQLNAPDLVVVEGTRRRSLPNVSDGRPAVCLLDEGRHVWPAVTADEVPVFSRPPVLAIPFRGGHPPAVSITDVTGGQARTVAEWSPERILSKEGGRGEGVTIGLKELEGTPCGLFAARVRGSRLGGDAILRFALVRGLHVETPNLDESGPPEVRQLLLRCPSGVNLDGQGLHRENGGYRLNISDGREYVKIDASCREGIRERCISLEVRVPRLLWDVSSSNVTAIQWSDAPVKRALHEIEAGSSPRLVVYADLPPAAGLSISLERGTVATPVAIRSRRGFAPLAPFLDTIRDSAQLRNEILIHAGEPFGTRTAVRVEAIWIISAVSIEQSLSGIDVSWKETVTPPGRALSMWAGIGQSPVYVPIPDGEQRVCLPAPKGDQARVQFRIDDGWQATPLKKPSPDEPNTFDLTFDGTTWRACSDADQFVRRFIDSFKGKNTEEWESDLELITQKPELGRRFLTLVSYELNDSSVESMITCLVSRPRQRALLAQLMCVEGSTFAQQAVSLVAHKMVEAGALLAPWKSEECRVLTDQGVVADGALSGGDVNRQLLDLLMAGKWSEMGVARTVFDHLLQATHGFKYRSFKLISIEEVRDVGGELTLSWVASRDEPVRRRRKGVDTFDHQRVLLPLRTLQSLQPFESGTRPQAAICAVLLRAFANGRWTTQREGERTLDALGRALFKTFGRTFSKELRWAEEVLRTEAT